ncbi:MAG: threonine--tRNA ligase, partial [Chloroflexi bacterium]
VGFLIEHYAGKFPVWLSPEQVRVIPITDQHNEYALQVVAQLKNAGVRVQAMVGGERMNAKIRNAQLMKVPFMLIVGDQEVKDGVVSLRRRDGVRQNGLMVTKFVAHLDSLITNRADKL